jgi:hypothetical protein
MHNISQVKHGEFWDFEAVQDSEGSRGSRGAVPNRTTSILGFCTWASSQIPSWWLFSPNLKTPSLWSPGPYKTAALGKVWCTWCGIKILVFDNGLFHTCQPKIRESAGPMVIMHVPEVHSFSWEHQLLKAPLCGYMWIKHQRDNPRKIVKWGNCVGAHDKLPWYWYLVGHIFEHIVSTLLTIIDLIHCDLPNKTQRHVPCEQQSMISQTPLIYLDLKISTVQGIGVASIRLLCLWMPPVSAIMSRVQTNLEGGYCAVEIEWTVMVMKTSIMPEESGCTLIVHIGEGRQTLLGVSPPPVGK